MGESRYRQARVRNPPGPSDRLGHKLCLEEPRNSVTESPSPLGRGLSANGLPPEGRGTWRTVMSPAALGSISAQGCCGGGT
jgi:hypothetical protein